LVIDEQVDYATEAARSGLEEPDCTICRAHALVVDHWGSFHLNLAPPMGVARCERCRLAFLSPRPGPCLRKALFEGQIPAALTHYARRPANYGAVSRSRTEIIGHRLTQLEALYRRKDAKPLPNLVDIGASSGVFVREAQRRGWKSFGIEPSSEEAQSARREGVDVVRAVAEALPIGTSSVEVAHAHHVFEHLADPLLTAREIFRILRPGGFVFVEVPNQFDNIMFRRDVLFGRVSQRIRNIRSIHHLWFFSARSLRRLMEAAGFNPVQVTDHYSWKPAGWRAPASIATRVIGRFAFGGNIVRAVAWKPQVTE
jgi:SAM-dependent methyltransferase